MFLPRLCLIIKQKRENQPTTNQNYSFASTVRNFGFIVTADMTPNKQVSKIGATCHIISKQTRVCVLKYLPSTVLPHLVSVRCMLTRCMFPISAEPTCSPPYTYNSFTGSCRKLNISFLSSLTHLFTVCTKLTVPQAERQK